MVKTSSRPSVVSYPVEFTPSSSDRALTIRDALRAVAQTVAVLQGPYRLTVKLNALGRLLWQTIVLLWVCEVQGVKGLGQWLVGRFRRDRAPVAQPAMATPQGPDVLITADSGEFEFHFGAEGLTLLSTAQAERATPTIPDQLRSTIRQTSLFQVIPQPYRRRRAKAIAYAQSGISFCSLYYDDAGMPQRVVRTVLSIDGDLLQQISHDALTHPRCREIIAAHHWLSVQLMNQLRLSIAAYLDKIALGGSLSVFVVNLGQSAPLLVSDPILAIPQVGLGAVGSMALTLLWSFSRTTLLPRLNRWLVRWIWRQLMTPRSPVRAIATWVLGLQ
jgi:hypothetical protein